MKKTGKRTYCLETPVTVRGWSAVVGKTEKSGPLGEWFDHFHTDEYLGKKSFEEAESELQKEAVDLVKKRSEISEKDIDFVFAGDLENQCAGANYCMRHYDIPYFGLYGACSTYAEALILSCMSIDGGFANNTLALSSSHNCTAERQYRFPLEYGALRPQTAQWTVTGAGATVLSLRYDASKPRISRFSVGRVVDYGVKDMNNMGAAMAPAAADTLLTFWEDTNTRPEEYDVVVTGDLGKVGHDLMRILVREKFPDFTNTYDCGRMIYDRTEQDVHSGGSGAGCSAAVINGYFFPSLMKRTYNKILFVGTGALMNTTRIQQKETIPAIAHLVEIEAGEI